MSPSDQHRPPHRARPWRGIAALALGLGACAPPPLPVDTGGGDSGATPDLPSISFIFPHNNMSAPVCSTFFVSVDIDNLEVVDWKESTEPVAGEGHWHLTDDITDDYYALLEPYGSIEADLNGEESRNYALTATLNENDHTPFSPTEYPDSIDRIEFTVSDSEDCVGGSGGGMSGY